MSSGTHTWGPEAWSRGFLDQSFCEVVSVAGNGSSSNGSSSQAVVIAAGDAKKIVAKTFIPAGTRIIREEAALLIPPFDIPSATTTTNFSSAQPQVQQQEEEEDLNVLLRLHTLRSICNGQGGSSSKDVVQEIINGLCEPSFAGGVGKQAVDKAVKLFLEEKEEGGDGSDATTLNRLLLAIDCNAHSVREQDVASRAVFPTVCKLNHSCSANCLFSSSSSSSSSAAAVREQEETGKGSVKKTIVAEVQVIRDVQQGEELLLNYLPVDYFTMANRQRQAHLLQTKYFACRCKEVCGKASISTSSTSSAGEEKDIVPAKSLIADPRRQITVLGDYLESSKSKESDLEDKTEQMLSGIREGIVSNSDLSLAFEACLATLGQKHWCSLTLGVFKCMRSFGGLLIKHRELNSNNSNSQDHQQQEKKSVGGSVGEAQQKLIDETHDCLVDFLLCYSELRAQDDETNTAGGGPPQQQKSSASSLEFWMAMTGPLSMFTTTLLDPDVSPLASAVANSPGSPPFSAKLVAALATLVICASIHLLDARKMFGSDGTHYLTTAGHWKRFVPKMTPILMEQLKKLSGTKVESSDGSAELPTSMYTFLEQTGLTRGESMVERGLLVPIHVSNALEIAMPLPARSARNLLLVPAVTFFAVDADEENITKDSDATQARLLLVKILLSVELTKYTQPYGQRAMGVLKPAINELTRQLESHSLKMLELVSPADDECTKCREFLTKLYEWRVEKVYLNVVGHPAGVGAEADKVAKAVKKDGVAFLKSIMSSLVENKSRNEETKKMIEVIRGLVKRVKE